jgi:hypothetical protein
VYIPVSMEGLVVAAAVGLFVYGMLTLEVGHLPQERRRTRVIFAIVAGIITYVTFFHPWDPSQLDTAP